MTRPLLFVGFFTGCTKKVDTEARWWEVHGANPVSEEDDEEDEEGEEDEAIFYGDLRVTDDGYEGIEAGVEVIEDGEPRCALFFVPGDIQADDSCDACEQAIAFTASELERETDDGCAALGFDPAELASGRLYVGWAGETAWMRTGGSWVEAGDVWSEGDAFGWDIWLD